MLHRLPWVIALAMAIVLPLGAADDDAKKDDKKDDKSEKSEKTEPSEKDDKGPAKPKQNWIHVGSLGGQIKTINGDNLVVTVTYPDVQANMKTLSKGMQQAMQNFQRSMRNGNRNRGRGRGGRPNPVSQMIQLQRAMMSFQMGEAQAYMRMMQNFKTKKQDIDVVLSSELKVRVAQPALEFDERGNIKKYTAEERRKLKGSPNAWGYPGDPNMLRMGQQVAVYVYRKKPPPKGAPVKGSMLKDKDSDSIKADDKNSPAMADAGDDHDGYTPVVRTIYIMRDVPDGTQGGNTTAAKPKGKKK